MLLIRMLRAQHLHRQIRHQKSNINLPPRIRTRICSGFFCGQKIGYFCDTIENPNEMKITEFLKHNYRHFNAAALIDAAEGYKTHLDNGGKMLVSLAGAMSTAELGISLAEMIRQDKVQIISCTGANLEEDVFNLVAHDYYERVPNYRELTPAQEQDLLDRHMNRV